MKKLIVFLLSLSLLIMNGCKSEDTDTCKEDKIDGKWQDVADSSKCSKEERGEAYLALAGFDYFDLIKYADTKTITEILGLTTANWQNKLNYYQQAAEIVRSSYEDGNDTAKTVFFFGSFLSLYTDFSGNLDNGAGTSTALDGEVTTEEVESFTSVEQNPSSGDAGVTLTVTNVYQIKSGGTYYLFNDDDDKLYEDDQADGLKGADEVPDAPDTGDNAAQIAAVLAAATEVNQVVLVDKIADPLASVGDGSIVINFSNQLLSYLSDVKNALNSLDIKDDSELVKPIIKFRDDLDNGGQCTSLEGNPALGLANLFVANTQETVLTDYSKTNKVSVDDITNLYSSFTSTDLSGISVPLGVKLVFKSAAGYTPYWDNAVNDVKAAMTNLKLLGTTDVAAGDQKVAYVELICAPELIAESNDD